MVLIFCIHVVAVEPEVCFVGEIVSVAKLVALIVIISNAAAIPFFIEPPLVFLWVKVTSKQ